MLAIILLPLCQKPGCRRKPLHEKPAETTFNSMDNLKQAVINKSRSYTACLSEAHRMLFDNIKVIFIRTWAYSLVLAMVSALYLSLYIHAMLYGGGFGLAVMLCVATLAAIAAGTVFQARVMHLVNGRPMRWNLARCGILTACCIVAGIVLIGVCAAVVFGIVASQQYATLADMQPVFICLGGMSVVVALLMLPFVYTSMKYMMEPECKLRRMAAKTYAVGLRHWGLVFTALFLAELCVIPCSLLVSLPMFIVLAANSYSVYGVNFIGDPTGLPSYFTAIQAAVFTLTFFIWAYVNIFIVFVCYFLYGSIATREKEKKEIANELKG